MGADPNTSLLGLVRWPTSTSLSGVQAGSRSEDFAPRHGPAAGGMPQAARLHEIAEVPEGSSAPVAALPEHLQYLSWAPALTQKRLTEGPIRTPGNCNLVREAHSWDLKVRHQVGAYFAALTDLEQEGTTSHS